MAESKVKVAVRVRPMDQRETDRKAECVVYMEGNQTVVKFTTPTFDGHCPAQKEFHFDHCFWSVNDEGLAKYASQEDVFTTLGEDILDNTFGGFNSCIFAYGQTGSGKTFSMMGTDEQPGLVPRICSALFSRGVSHLTSLQVEATYLEIYNEKVQDLLCPTTDFKALKVREHKFLGPYVEGLSHHAVKNAEDIKSLILEGNKCRKISNTKMNEQSSRSHAIFTLRVTQTFHKENTMKELLSKVSLVDLAGSERTSITGATGEALKQSSNINKSLSSLGLVINSLAELSEGRRRSSYVNYRDSVLTWLLKNNLGGNSKTIMLATISPASINYQETLSTLKYADNAKCIVNKPRVNEDLNARTIAELAKEVKALREQLQQAESKHKEDLQARLNESETLLRELKLSWEEKLQKTEISALERQKQLQRLGIMVEHSGIRVDEAKCYLINLSVHSTNQNELFLYYLGENTKIGAGDSQDIKITGPGIEMEHCVIDILQDGNIILTPNHNAETFVNSSRVNKGVMLYHEDKIMLGNKASFMLHKPSAKSKIAQESPDKVHDDPGNQPEEGNKQGNESAECSTQKINIPQNTSHVSTEISDNKHLDQDSCERKNTTTETMVSPKDGGNSEPGVSCKHKKTDEDNASDIRQISEDDDKTDTSINDISQTEMEQSLSFETHISKDVDDKTDTSINLTSQTENEQNISSENELSREDRRHISMDQTPQINVEQNINGKKQISKADDDDDEDDDEETNIFINPTSQSEVEKELASKNQIYEESDDSDQTDVSIRSKPTTSNKIQNLKDTIDISINPTSQSEMKQNLSTVNQVSKDDDDKNDISINQTSQTEMEQSLSFETQIPKDVDDDKTETSINQTTQTESEQNIDSEEQLSMEDKKSISVDETSQMNMEQHINSKKQISKENDDDDDSTSHTDIQRNDSKNKISKDDDGKTNISILKKQTTKEDDDDDDKTDHYVNSISQTEVEQNLSREKQVSIDNDNDDNEDDDYKTDTSINLTSQTENEQNIRSENELSREDETHISMDQTPQINVEQNINGKKQISNDDDDDEESNIFIKPTAQSEVEKELASKNQIYEEYDDSDQTDVSIRSKPMTSNKIQNLKDTIDIFINPTSQTKMGKKRSNEKQVSKEEDDRNVISINQTSQTEIEQNLRFESPISKDEDDDDKTDNSINHRSQTETELNQSREEEASKDDDNDDDDDKPNNYVNQSSLTKMQQNLKHKSKIPKDDRNDISVNETSHIKLEQYSCDENQISKVDSDTTDSSKYQTSQMEKSQISKNEDDDCKSDIPINPTAQSEMKQNLSTIKQVSKDDDDKNDISINQTSQTEMEQSLSFETQIPTDVDDDKTETSINQTTQTESERNIDSEEQLSMEDKKSISVDQTSQMNMEQNINSKKQISKENDDDDDKSDISINSTSHTDIQQNDSKNKISKDDDGKTDHYINSTSQTEVEQNLSREKQVTIDNDNDHNEDDDYKTDTSINLTSQTENEQNIRSENELSREDETHISMDQTPQINVEQNINGKKEISNEDDDEETNIFINPTAQSEVEKELASKNQISKENVVDDDDDNTDISTSPTSQTEIDQNIRITNKISKDNGDKTEISINQTSQTEMEQNLKQEKSISKDGENINVSINPTSPLLELTFEATGITTSENNPKKEDTSIRCAGSSVGVVPSEKAANYIRRSRKLIMNILLSDFDTFLDEVDSENIITQDEYFKVENMENDKKKKARTLVNLILQKDESTCRAFLQCLQLDTQKGNSPEQEVKKSPTEESEKINTEKEKGNSPEHEVKKSPTEESEKINTEKEKRNSPEQEVKKSPTEESEKIDTKKEKRNSPEQEVKKSPTEESEKIDTKKEKRNSPEQEVKKSPTEESEKIDTKKEKGNSPEQEVKRSPTEESEKINTEKEKRNSPEQEVKKSPTEESEKIDTKKEKGNSPEPEVKKSPTEESDKINTKKEKRNSSEQEVKKSPTEESEKIDTKKEKGNSPEQEVKRSPTEESEKINTEKDKIACFMDLLKKIDFQNYYISKLTLKKVLDIGAECLPPSIPRGENVAWYFIRKLMSLHEEARNISTIEHRAEISGDDHFMLDVDSDLSDAIHPLDLQCAIFHCSDHFLQQEMISKMSMCQFSVPLLLPAIDSPDYTFMLWAMRGIVKKWRPQSLAESKGFREEHLVNIPMPTFSFVRLGRCRLSKSKILNQVLSSTQHCQDIFVHRDMEGGNVERTLSLGLVEISWYFPAGKGIFAEPVAVTNLRGALESNLKPFSFLAEISSFVVVFLETISKSHCELLLRYKNSKTKYLFIIVPEEQKSKAEREEMIKSVMTMSERKEDNVLVITKTTNEATIVKKIRSALLKLQKKNANNLSIENMAHTATEQEICVDEHNAECQAAKEQAMKITPEICDVVQYKGKTMTLQAQLLKDLSKLEKECCQMKKQGNRNGEEYKSELRRKCDEIRSKQWKCEIPEGIDHFIKGIETNNRWEKLYFLSWLKYYLDLAARKTLTSLQQEYKEKYSQANESKELKEIDQKISDSSLGIEHFLREVSQFYEVWHIMGKKKYLHKERINLPESGANLLLDGFPLELINGDASRIPVQWVTDVLNIVNTKTGGQSRIRVITVLGVQSTGKSTLLNTMFGLQFPVASGRCTRGAFMTLIKVKKNLSKEIGCEFLLVIDTEGLKAPELDSLEDSYEHDNELATLVVGLSDITIVNMAMENTAEMKDILQIVVHSFLRMKEIGKKPNCQFVHQNVSDVSAPVMNMRDRNKLLEQLNEMTRTVATMEKKPQYKVFNDVMGYDSEHHHWYIPSLWQGVPPMAPVSAGYSESVAEMKQNLLKLIKESQTKPQTIPEFVRWMEDLWNAVKHENFIFSFRNSLVASAYNKLSMHYSELEWKFSKLIHEWFTNTETVIKNQSAETLENKGKECCIKLESLISAEQNKLITWVEDYFQHEKDCVYLIKHKEDFKISAKRLGENLRQSSYEKYNNAIQIQKQQLNIKNVRMQYIEKIEQKVSSLVEECRKKRHQLDEENMEKEFENMWQHTVEELKVKPLLPHDVEKDMLLELTKTMRDKGSAVNERLNKTQHLPKPNEKSGVGKKKGWTAYFKNIFKRFTGTEKDEIMFESIIIKCCKYSKEQSGRDVDYDDTYCKHLLNIIDDDLKEKSNISAEVELDIKLNILGHAVEDFQKMHNNFVKKNDPYLQLKTLKSEYFNTFMNVFQEKNESQNLARRIYDTCLKPAVIDYTIRNLGIELVDDIMNSEGSKTYTSRTFFQYTVLLNLLEENIFEKYTEYSANYEEFVKNWILEYIKDKYKNFNSIQSIILSRITKKIETLLNNTDMWNQSKNVEGFLDGFQEELSSDLVFPQEKVKAILFQNSANTKEFIKNLKNFMTDIKEEIISETKFQSVEAILSRVTVKPQDVLFKKVFGCGNQCPFCKVPCEAGGEEHKEHFASVHRPDGLGRYRWTLTSILSHDICTTSVCGNTSFTNKDAQFHPFKRYKEIYPDWKIQPDPSIEASDYWKFVLKEFNDQFAEEYNAKPAKHPEEWNNLTKEMAIESLKKTFNM
ncbi:uncharacterized protein [Phyllobates terribilis]|uniref:uncharacterized protein isoform X7 n=1 Tax=Phyllobates terribilis TaxID=111132 RepID=UPI003CCB5CB1